MGQSEADKRVLISTLGNHWWQNLVVASSKMKEVLNEFHNGASGGHLGVTKILERIKQHFYWVGYQQAVVYWIANCIQCIAAKGPVRRSRGQLQQCNSDASFEQITPVSNAGNRYVLVVIDSIKNVFVNN